MTVRTGGKKVFSKKFLSEMKTLDNILSPDKLDRGNVLEEFEELEEDDSDEEHHHRRRLKKSSVLGG
jgi:hypothetical protein